MGAISIEPVTPGGAGMADFINVAWTVNGGDPLWSPPLRVERRDLLSPRKNPYFEHADVGLWVVRRNGKPVGRISAQVDVLVQAHMGPGTGQWGFFDCIDDTEAAAALIRTAEDWLRQRGMTRALGPFSLSYWDEIGQLVDGFDTPPQVMMGHAPRHMGPMIEAHGYGKAKDLYAYLLDITVGFPERINRIVAAGDANPRIVMRKPLMKRFEAEAAVILDILNDAWSDNWGYVPLTDAEVQHAAKNLKQIVVPDFIRICEFDGEPVGFMIVLPNLNDLIRDLDGSLLPLGWAKLLLRLRKPWTDSVRVPLMGVRKKLQSSRTGALMAFMMIEHLRLETRRLAGATRAELSWILEDNLPMRGILEAIGCFIYKTYRVYEKAL